VSSCRAYCRILNPNALARGTNLREESCFAEGCCPPRLFSKRLLSHGNASEIHGIEENYHWVRVDASSMDKAIAAGLIYCNVDSNLGKMDWCFYPVFKRVTNVDGWNPGKFDESFPARYRVMGVNQIWRFTK
jgi:hypothetical protein